jgi:hypothetical protein
MWSSSILERLVLLRADLEGRACGPAGIIGATNGRWRYSCGKGMSAIPPDASVGK